MLVAPAVPNTDRTPSRRSAPITPDPTEASRKPTFAGIGSRTPVAIIRPARSRTAPLRRNATALRHAVGPAAVAAPTASLHFDESLLVTLEAQGVKRTTITLHVGAGTFQPLRSERIEDHIMHAEWAEVPAAACEAINATRAAGRRVIAIGTTVVRALESAALATAGAIAPWTGETRIFITPGFHWRAVDALLTNFHLPRSTLLMLVSAFVGRETVLSAYAHAVAQRYRFFSYGDAMFITSRAP